MVGGTCWLLLPGTCRLSLVDVDPLPLLNLFFTSFFTLFFFTSFVGKNSIVLVWSMLPGQWPNQIVKNLFALTNVKENGR